MGTSGLSETRGPGTFEALGGSWEVAPIDPMMCLGILGMLDHHNRQEAAKKQEEEDEEEKEGEEEETSEGHGGGEQEGEKEKRTMIRIRSRRRRRRRHRLPTVPSSTPQA